MIDFLTSSSEIIGGITSKYTKEVEYDRLNPSSILIESPIMILISLTITSLFILVFLIIGIRRLVIKVKNPNQKFFSRNKQRKSKEINSSKLINVNNIENTKKNGHSEISIKNSLTYQRIKAELKRKKKPEEEVILNSEIRKLNNNNNNDFSLNSNKRNTLCLSGPLIIFEKQPEENLSQYRGKMEDKKEFLDPDFSSVERVGSFKSESGLASVFDIHEEEKKENL